MLQKLFRNALSNGLRMLSSLALQYFFVIHWQPVKIFKLEVWSTAPASQFEWILWVGLLFGWFSCGEPKNKRFVLMSILATLWVGSHLQWTFWLHQQIKGVSSQMLGLENLQSLGKQTETTNRFAFHAFKTNFIFHDFRTQFNKSRCTARKKLKIRANFEQFSPSFKPNDKFYPLSEHDH